MWDTNLSKSKWLFRVLFAIISYSGLTAQESSDTHSFCWRADDSCRIIVLTEFGIYSVKSLSGITADLGTLFSIGSHDALGLSLHFSADDNATLGPMIRYRHWLNHKSSFELGIGLPLIKYRENPEYRGWTKTAYGIIKWNPVYWLGIAVRPELRHEYIPRIYARGNQYYQKSNAEFQVSAGIEIGYWPGLTLMSISFISAVLVGLAQSTLGPG